LKLFEELKRLMIAMNKKQKKSTMLRRSVIMLFLLFAIVITMVGCATSDEGSSIPWAEPEPWEQQPSFGVPY